MKGSLSPVKLPACRKLFSVFFHYLLCNLVLCPAISPFPSLFPSQTHIHIPPMYASSTNTSCRQMRQNGIISMYMLKTSKIPQTFSFAILSISGNIDLSLVCFPGSDTVVSFSLKRIQAHICAAQSGHYTLALVPRTLLT